MRALPRRLLALPCVALVALGGACAGAGEASPSASGTSPASSGTSPNGSSPTTQPKLSPPATSGLAPLRATRWTSVYVPGDVCPGRARPVRLSHGRATIPDPRGVRFRGGVTVTEVAHVFGDLYGPGRDVAALNVWCAGANGTAASELRDSWVVYTDADRTLRPIATLTPRQPARAQKTAPHVPYFDTSPGGIAIAPSTVTVKELWYRAGDHTCCPSEHATTVWRAHGSSFSSSTEIGG